MAAMDKDCVHNMTIKFSIFYFHDLSKMAKEIVDGAETTSNAPLKKIKKNIYATCYPEQFVFCTKNLAGEDPCDIETADKAIWFSIIFDRSTTEATIDFFITDATYVPIEKDGGFTFNDVNPDYQGQFKIILDKQELKPFYSNPDLVYAELYFAITNLKIQPQGPCFIDSADIS